MLGGVIPVLYSYFDTAGAVDLEAHERQIAWVRQGGVAGITLFGLVSEGSALSPSERKLLLTHTCSILPPDEVLLVTVRPDDDVEDLVGRAVESARQRRVSKCPTLVNFQPALRNQTPFPSASLFH